MTRRLVVAVLLIAFAVPGVARADTRVVLSNESRDTEVVTGEARFVNGGSTSSTSVVDSDSSVSEQQGAAVSPVSGGSVQAVAPAGGPSGSTAQEQAAAAQEVTRSVEVLFVGLPTGTSVSP